MWELDCEESWAPKNWCFWTVALEKTLERVPWTAKRSNQSILKISPGCSLKGKMLRLKLQYFGHLMWRADSLEKTLMLGGIGSRRRRGRQDEIAGWHQQLNGREFEWTPGDGGQGGLACCYWWVTKSQTRLSDWNELNWGILLCMCPMFLPICPSTEIYFSPSLSLYSQLFKSNTSVIMLFLILLPTWKALLTHYL